MKEDPRVRSLMRLLLIVHRSEQFLPGKAKVRRRIAILKRSIQFNKQAFAKSTEPQLSSYDYLSLIRTRSMLALSITRYTSRSNRGTRIDRLFGAQAVGVSPGEKGGVRLITKKTKHINRPASNEHEVAWNSHTSGPK